MAKKNFYALNQRKQERIRQAAYRIFSEADYESIGIRDVIEEAGISIGSFYLYFDNKDDLFLTLFSELEARIVEQELSGTDSLLQYEKVGNLKDFLSPQEYAFGISWYRLPDTVMYKYYHSHYVYDAYGSYLTLFQELEKEGKLHPSFSAEFAFYFFNSSFFILFTYLRSRQISDPEEIHRLKTHYFERVIFPTVFKEYKERFLQEDVKI